MSVEVRISLAAADIPGDPRMAPLVALQPAMDTAQRANAAYVGRGENFDWGMPGSLYVDDCLPIYNGYTSLRTGNSVTLSGSLPYKWPTPFAVQDVEGVFLLAYNPINDQHQIVAVQREANTGALVQVYSPLVTPVNIIEFDLVSVAHVNGRTFVAAADRFLSTSDPANFALFEYDGTAFTAGTTGIPGLVPGVSIGSTRRAIAGLGSYLLLICDDEIIYSVPGQVNDFTGIGAGRFTPSSFEGTITAVRELANGIIIYTTVGAWSIVQTFNGANPFKSRQFSGLPGSSSVGSEPNSSEHYVYASSGFYAVTLNASEPLLMHKYREMVSETQVNFVPSTTQLSFNTVNTSTQDIQLHVVDSRYVIFNCKAKLLAWVYDIHLRRFGKIRGIFNGFFTLANNHVAHYSSEAMIYAVTPSNQLVFFTGDNAVVTSTMPAKQGTLIVGPIVQQRNDRRTSIHSIYLQNNQQPINGPTPPTIKVISSRDTIEHPDRVVTFLHQGNGLYLGRVTGRYLYIVIEGDIETSNLLVKLTASGM